jgi:2-polyprenyl-6-methoxyphenol hydroxylase-like FAD-dependent oxidoreductase
VQGGLRRSSHDVLIAGAGIAAAATALRLCALGLKPLMLGRTAGVSPGVEAIPAAALPLFRELGMEHVLEEAGATLVRGFENLWDSKHPDLRPGYWIHVERDKLAAAALREALKRGASFRFSQGLPQLCREPDSVRIMLDGVSLDFEAAVDATGRAAVWSRPTRRHGSQIADLYDAVPDGKGMPARIVRLSEGWAYRIGVPSRNSVAIVSPVGRTRRVPDALLEQALCISASACRFVGRRPAFAQWSEHPVNGRSLAVGDAAIAYDPLAGQGIRFALSSAITASSVINTWRKAPSAAETASRFYEEFAVRSREAHIQFVDQARTNASPTVHEAPVVPETLVFSKEVVQTALQFNGEIRMGSAFRLPGGNCVRWAGEADLIEVQNSLPAKICTSDLIARFMVRSDDSAKAQALLEWCLRHKVLVGPPACPDRQTAAG